MPIRNSLRALLFGSALAASAPALAGPLYTITALPAGTNPTGINSVGQIVGDMSSATGLRRAFVWSSGALVQFGTLGGDDSTGTAINDSGRATGYASDAHGNAHAFVTSGAGISGLNLFGAGRPSFGRAINSAGEVAGLYYAADGTVRAFLHSGGVDIDIGSLGGNFTSAGGINAAGHVVGFAALDDSSPWLSHAFLYADGVMRDLGTMAGASLSEATAINDFDHITGHGWVFGSHHAFLYLDGVMNDLGTLGGRTSFAYDINNHDQVVGNSQDASDFEHFAYLYSAGVMTNLNALIDPASGWTLYNATGINDSGQIAAYGCREGECGGVLLELDPALVPEPSSVALFGIGLGWFGWRRASAAYRRG